MLKKIGIFAIGAAFAGTAHAQSLPAGFYVNGSAEHNYLTRDDGFDTNVSEVDLTFGYSGAAAGGAPFGAELYVYHLEREGFDTSPAIAGALYYDTSYGRFSVGMPKSAVDDYVDMPNLGRTLVFDTSPLGSFTTSFVRRLSLFDDTAVYGVRFDGAYNGVKFGVSAHAPEDSGGGYAVTAATQYAFNNVVASVGLETFGGDSSVPEGVGVFGLLDADFGQYGGELFVSAPLGFDNVLVNIEAQYRPMDDLELYVGYYAITDDPGLNSGYVGAEYSFLDAAYVGASYLDNPLGGDSIYNLYVGYDLNFGG